MKGNGRLIETLNSLLADELTAINQYMVHAEMNENWGYTRLHDHFMKRSVDEMKHAEKLIGRIIFLEGIPVVSDYRKISIGAEISSQLEFDHDAETGAIASYNEAIRLAGEVEDFATREMLESLLNDEDRHIDGIEELMDQLKHMGAQIFLSACIRQ
jgi:bacterioferritin